MFVFRSLVFVRGKGDRSSPPPGKITNEQFSNLVYFWVKHEELVSLDKKVQASRRQFLEKLSRYAKIQANLDDGSSKPGDVWEELAIYLHLTGEERAAGRELEVLLEGEKEEMPEARDMSALEEREEGQEPMEEHCEEEGKEVAALAREEDECELARLGEELPHLFAAGLLAKDLEEVARRICQGSFKPSIKPSILSNGLVKELQSPKMAEYLTVTNVSMFVMKILGVFSEELKHRVRRYIRLTTTRMERLGAGEWEPWVYTNQVLAPGMGKVESSLDSLYAKLGLLKRTPSPCLQCGGAGAYHCRSCCSAWYCSEVCQVEHWEAGHSEECDILTTHLHGPRGLAPPPPDPRPELKAACVARKRWAKVAHSAQELYVATLGQVEEGREREQEGRKRVQKLEEDLEEIRGETFRLARAK